MSPCCNPYRNCSAPARLSGTTRRPVHNGAMAQPPRREQRRTHLDASAVPVERAYLARAGVLEGHAADYERDVMEPDGALPEFIEAKLTLAREFRALAEELHWW